MHRRIEQGCEKRVRASHHVEVQKPKRLIHRDADGGALRYVRATAGAGEGFSQPRSGCALESGVNRIFLSWAIQRKHCCPLYNCRFASSFGDSSALALLEYWRDRGICFSAAYASTLPSRELAVAPDRRSSLFLVHTCRPVPTEACLAEPCLRCNSTTISTAAATPLTAPLQTTAA